MQREGQAHSPTKSEWDSAVFERLVRSEGWCEKGGHGGCCRRS